jgi:hypothetical protein
VGDVSVVPTPSTSVLDERVYTVILLASSGGDLAAMSSELKGELVQQNPEDLGDSRRSISSKELSPSGLEKNRHQRPLRGTRIISTSISIVACGKLFCSKCVSMS